MEFICTNGRFLFHRTFEALNEPFQTCAERLSFYLSQLSTRLTCVSSWSTSVCGLGEQTRQSIPIKNATRPIQRRIIPVFNEPIIAMRTRPIMNAMMPEHSRRIPKWRQVSLTSELCPLPPATRRLAWWWWWWWWWWWRLRWRWRRWWWCARCLRWWRRCRPRAIICQLQKIFR